MDNDSKFKNILKNITDGNELNTTQSKLAFEIIMSGEATDAQISSFLTAIKTVSYTHLTLPTNREV